MSVATRDLKFAHFLRAFQDSFAPITTNFNAPWTGKDGVKPPLPVDDRYCVCVFARLILKEPLELGKRKKTRGLAVGVGCCWFDMCVCIVLKLISNNPICANKLPQYCRLLPFTGAGWLNGVPRMVVGVGERGGYCREM